MQFEAEIVVPRNTTLYVGKIAEQARYRGEAEQIRLSKDYSKVWIQKIRALKIGEEYTIEEVTQKFTSH